jgi:hypothetical protein
MEKQTFETIKRVGGYIWLAVEMIGEFLTYVIYFAIEFWVISIIIIFLIIAWYFGLFSALV